MKAEKDIEGSLDKILSILNKFPEGANIDEIWMGNHPKINIRTLQRRLTNLIEQQAIRVSGNARATIYKLAVKDEETPEEIADNNFGLPLTKESEVVRSVITRAIQKRKPVTYQRSFIESYRPNIDSYLSKDEMLNLAKLGNTIKSA